MFPQLTLQSFDNFQKTRYIAQAKETIFGKSVKKY